MRQHLTDIGDGFVLRTPFDAREKPEIVAGYRVNPDYVPGINDGTRNAPMKPAPVTITLERADGKTARVKFPQLVRAAAVAFLRSGHAGYAPCIPGAECIESHGACNVFVARFGKYAGIPIRF